MSSSSGTLRKKGKWRFNTCSQYWMWNYQIFVIFGIGKGKRGVWKTWNITLISEIAVRVDLSVTRRENIPQSSWAGVNRELCGKVKARRSLFSITGTARMTVFCWHIMQSLSYLAVLSNTRFSKLIPTRILVLDMQEWNRFHFR